MRRNKRGLQLVAILLMAILVLYGCSTQSPADKLVGRWVLEDDPEMGFEFFAGGEGVAFIEDGMETIEWSFSGDSLMISDRYGYETLLLPVEELTNSRLVVSVEGQETVLRKD